MAQQGGEAGDSDAVLSIMSWNVAGWQSTQAAIIAGYGSVGEWLRKMHCDILCLQESKVKSSQLCPGVPSAAIAHTEGYASYWAFNHTDPHLNGVCTWVRDGIEVLGATQMVFGDSEIDLEGRCLLTDHGSFVIFNVYAHNVPQTDFAAKLGIKLRFLTALQSRMDAFRAMGKRVFVVGDLNVTHRREDCKISRRVVFVDDAGNCDAVPEGDTRLSKCASSWYTLKEISDWTQRPIGSFEDVGECAHWPNQRECVEWLRALLQTGWADVHAEVHPLAAERFSAWHQLRNHRFINLGSRIDYVLCDRETLSECVVFTPTSSLRGGIESKVEATSKEAALHAATCFGAWHAAPTSGALQGDGLQVRSRGSGRTGAGGACASGAQIVAAWGRRCKRGTPGWTTRSFLPARCRVLCKDCCLQHRCAVRAGPVPWLVASPATYGACKSQALFDGGLRPSRRYTPPSWSDHIPVCVALRNMLMPSAQPGRTDSAEVSTIPRAQTAACQPWAAQASITSFFQQLPPGARCNPLSEPPPPKPKPSVPLSRSSACAHQSSKSKTKREQEPNPFAQFKMQRLL